MKKKDLYEKLNKYLEIPTGKRPDREEFKDALRQTITPEEIDIFFLMPYTGNGIILDKLKVRAKKKGITEEQLQRALDRLSRAGASLTWETPRGRVYARANSAYLCEEQARKQKDTPVRKVYAAYWDRMMMDGLLSKTPYYRVVPHEAALTHTPATRKIDIKVSVPDKSAVLPLDVISKMVASCFLIGVSECSCRKVQKILDNDCGHPLETCFCFNELADWEIGIGTARKIDYNEAMRILAECNAAGLVHNIDNCEGEFHSLCNCCSCSCFLFRSRAKELNNTMAESRFIASLDTVKCKGSGACINVCPVQAIKMDGAKASLDQSKCVGCGKCVSNCPSSAIQLVLRPKEPKMDHTWKDLWLRLGAEALLKNSFNKLIGK